MKNSVFPKLLTAALFFSLLVLGAAHPHGAFAGEPTTISLNTASSFKLMKIPYMSRGLARAIVEYRDQSGHFKAPADLLKVPGMTPETLEQLNVTVDANGEVVATFAGETGGEEGMAIPNY